MSVFDRSKCPKRYEYVHGTNQVFMCCRLHRFETGHVACNNVKDFECPWELNERIKQLEECIQTSMKE